MSNKRIWLFGTILFVLAGAILATQVSWIFQAAKIEESFLNQRINMALCSAMDALSQDKGICSRFESCHATAAGTFALALEKQEKETLDSVIRHHLVFYNINVPFTTTYSPYKSEGPSPMLPAGQALLYPKVEAGVQNILVSVDIPSKSELVRAQINTTFVLSLLVLSLLTIILFSSLRGMVRERSIRTQTIEFINAMAHDLKTPISNISLAINLLGRDRPTADEQTKAYLSIVETETERLKHRTRQILGVASVDAVIGNEATKSRIDLHDLIANTINSFNLQLRELRGEVSTAFAATRHEVSTSQVELSSALSNILDNAIKYSNSAPMIEIRTTNNNESVFVEIRDYGPGIARSEQELIFRKSYRSAKNRSEGFGLGLYLARNLVEKQGGKLSVSSDGVHGSCFTISLPVN